VGGGRELKKPPSAKKGEKVYGEIKAAAELPSKEGSKKSAWGKGPQWREQLAERGTRESARKKLIEGVGYTSR